MISLWLALLASVLAAVLAVGAAAGPANLPVGKATSSARLVNLSVRSRAGTGDQTLTMGFGLAGRGPERVLVRSVGPGLIPLGFFEPLADPQLKLFDAGSRRIQENDDWDGSARLSQLFTAVGAFPLDPGSKDAALDAVLTPQTYTAQSSANGTDGVTLMEVYDADPGVAGQLVNASVRTTAGSGLNTLIAGFVLAGTGSKTVLIRAVGPSLVKFGVSATTVLTDPKLSLSFGGPRVAENDNWSGGAELKAAFKAVGAFDYDSDTSKDAALLATLEPGAYTVVVSGENATTGVVLVEIYLVP